MKKQQEDALFEERISQRKRARQIKNRKERKGARDILKKVADGQIDPDEINLEDI